MSWYYRRYTPPKRREAKGGIKPRTKRGAFGESWWAKKWVEALEEQDEGRLQRGRSYARSGQVLAIEFDGGLITAKVQGSKRSAYNVSLKFSAVGEEAFVELIDLLGRRARFAAHLLAGYMPDDMESAFEDADLDLVPDFYEDIEVRCECYDSWGSFCKHACAVSYLVAEELDRDPFLLFELCGVSRDMLLAALSGEELAPEPEPEIGAAQADETGALTEPEPRAPEPPAPPAVPVDGLAFWHGAREAEPPGTGPADQTHGEAVLRRLAPFPFWRGETPLRPALEAVYQATSAQAVALLVGMGSREKS